MLIIKRVQKYKTIKKFEIKIVGKTCTYNEII